MMRLFAVLLAVLLLPPARAEELRLLAAELPPYSFRVPSGSVSEFPGPGRGIVFDVVTALAQRVGQRAVIEFMPWHRAQQIAMSEPDVGILALTRTPEREALFKWVGPVGAAEWILYGSAERGLKLQNIEEARSLLIGTYNGDARDEYFRSRGFRVESVSDDLSNPRKLLLNRIDLWAASLVRGALLISQNGWSEQIVPVLSFHKVDLYVACNPSVPTPLIDKLNATLQGMVRDGTTRTLEKKYARWPLPPN